MQVGANTTHDHVFFTFNFVKGQMDFTCTTLNTRNSTEPHTANPDLCTCVRPWIPKAESRKVDAIWPNEND